MNVCHGRWRNVWSAMNAFPFSAAAGTALKNGELLRLAEPLFDLSITSDQSLAYQQNLTGHRIAILLLSTNKLRRIIASADLILSVVSSIRADVYRRLEIP